MASIVPPRARSSRTVRRFGLITAGVATSLVLMGASLAALTGNVLSVTHWSASHDPTIKGQILPEIPSGPTLGGATVVPASQTASGGADKQAAVIPAPAATAAPTPLPATGGVTPTVSPRAPTGAGGGAAP